MTTNAFAFITSEAVVVRTLAAIRSLQEVGAIPAAGCYVLCLDRGAYETLQRTTAHDHVRLLTATDLPEITPFANRPISRFAVTCKPFLLRWCLTEGGADKALYADSDIWFVSDPSFLFEDMDQSDVLIVPFIINAEATIRDWKTLAKNAQRTGYFNAGFVGCSRRASAFLDWWANRCAYSTFRDFYQDISGDQKYLNWAPLLFPNVKPLRHYGLNIKHWSTQYVSLVRHADGSATLNGDPLVFFHFSQDLGNLLFWGAEFHPEVSRYLEVLEQARVDTGQPYIDMPARDNRDLERPLLPRSGKLALFIRMLRDWRKPLIEARRSVRATIARTALALPRSVQQQVARHYLRRWKLAGDAKVSSYAKLMARLGELQPDDRVVFLGASRLAYYLAYLGCPTTIYDPFQGHYNDELRELFNLQWREATKMYGFLNLGDQLSLNRLPISTVTSAPAPNTVVLSARHTPEEMSAVLGALINLPTLKRVITIFNPAWPDSYRQNYRDFMQRCLDRHPISLEAVDGFDLYQINAAHHATDEQRQEVYDEQ